MPDALIFDAAARPPAGADLVAVAANQGPKGARTVAGVAVDADYLGRRRFEGKVGQTEVLPGADGRPVVVVGLGKAAEATLDTYRRAAAAVVRAAGRAASAAFVPGRPPAHLDAGDVAQAVAEGAALASYRYDVHKAPATDEGRLSRFTLVGTAAKDSAARLQRGARVAKAVALARDLVNEPPGNMTPSRFAEVAAAVAAESGLEIEVLDEDAIDAERLGGLAGVARGSAEPARLVRLRRQAGAARTLALVGKGITFDSGGLSLKTAEGMMTMKTDMSGAAAVLAATAAVADLGIGVNILALMPLTENMPGGRAIKPGDVLRARNGKTIEVLNTDAEGRLVLADGLSLAVEAGPDAIVDLATLTGACVVALGRRVAGLMGNDDQLAAQVEAAAARAGEGVWRLPLPQEYRRDIDSEVADIKNIGAAGQAGALVAGLFLKEFVGEVPWAHLDIAGPARAESDDGYLVRGGTGFGVRTLIELGSAMA
ncbi:MAG TPA: leucyl aminopeptidase [Acidimicrobiales bacterium]|nr:leucyl aminopeptidase [Acidimicrobiales bacterium]